MLNLDDITARYDGFTLSADFTLDAGTKTAILGPSGGGKSTLLSIIGGFLPPDHGSLRWNDTDFTMTDPGDRPVGMLFQAHNLFPHLTLIENTLLALSPTLRPTAAQKEQARALLDTLGIGEHGARLPRQVSGGQAQRAAIARLILQNRPITLLDEPFAALGPRQRRDLRDLVSQKTSTILMVTHQVEDARDWADHVLWIENGTVSSPIRATDFFNSPPQSAREYLGLA